MKTWKMISEKVCLQDKHKTNKPSEKLTKIKTKLRKWK